MSRKLRGIWTLVLVALPAGIVEGGSLEPPGGPPAPTMKTMSEVEPRTPISAVPSTISESGAYYLTGNLTCTTCSSTVPGILVNADNVSIDLNGFTLACSGSCYRGIEVNSATTKIVRIGNGTVREWVQGVQAFNVVSSVFENLTVYHNLSFGISVNGENNVVRNCVGQYNAVGVQVVANTPFVGGSVIEGCVLTLNSNGIEVARNTLVRNNRVTKSTNRGIIALGNDNTIQDNHVSGTTDIGIVANPGSGNLIIRNSLTDNATNFLIGAGNTIGPIGPADTATSPWANVTD